MSELVRLGWTPSLEQQTGERRGRLAARITSQHRALYGVAGEFDGFAEVGGRMRHETPAAAELPVVGDWVLVAAAAPGGRAVINHRLDRRSVVLRKAAGRAVAAQAIAANVDTLFVVTAFAGDLNPRRLERYVTATWETGVTPVVVLNKADLTGDPQAAAADLRARLFGVDVVAISALADENLEELSPYLLAGSTVALAGSSGVGKSTIVNRLLGHERQAVGMVSTADGRGRHTTTGRELLALPGGALLIDTPGMRELQPWAGEAAVEGAFDDIASIAERCRFADCAHAGEPGCAVRMAVAEGVLGADRLDNYRKLLRELAFEERKHDKRASANAKRRWKQIHKAQRAFNKR